MKADRIILSAALVLMLGCFCWALRNQLHEIVIDTGDTAPSFSITTDSGRTVTAKDFGGKLLLLNFWATWCDTCIQEIPSLNLLSSRLGPKGLVVIGVSVDQDEKRYNNFLQRSPLAYQTARDPEEKINASYGTIQYPESYLIRDGKVVRKYISSQNWVSPEILADVNSNL